MRSLLLTGMLLQALATSAQVQVDAPIQLVGSDPAQQQVLGLDTAQQAGHALDAATEGSGKPRWAGDATGAAWSVDLPWITGAPTTGTSFFLRVQAQQAGTVTLLLNGTGPYPVLLAPGLALQGDALPAGTVISLVFDGTQFHITNGAAHARRDCPTGMMPVGDLFCVEVAERPVSTYYDAAVACVQAGARLCTWSEWQQACLQQVALGLADMIGNWEWTNNAANEDHGVRVVGNTSCNAAGVIFSTDAGVFSRCCYTR